MIRRWLALTYYLYALRLAALSHFYFNQLYKQAEGFANPSFGYSSKQQHCQAHGKEQCQEMTVLQRP